MNLNDPIFHDEAKAREYFEAIRWPHGPFCPHCGETEKVYRLEGKSHRPGLLHCNSCKGSFTVTTGGVMESSHIPLTKWALGFRLYAASKKGFSAHQLHRSIGITYKSAWFMAHRIREAMEPSNPPPIGGKGSTVESDETFIGRREGRKLRAGTDHKIAVLTLVERGGRSRSFKIGTPTKAAIQEVLRRHIDSGSRLMTDEAGHYGHGHGFADHQTVIHSKGEYARGDVSTNTVEGFFSIFKRGMVGTYQHCGEQHLQRYLAEFDFRYSNRASMGVDDEMRAEIAVKGAEGKRLTYHQVGGSEGA